MPSDIIPLNPDLSLYQNVTLQSRFTAPGQQVSLEFNPFTFDAAAFDCVRLALLLVGQGDIGQEVGLVVPGAIKEIVQEFNHAKDLVNLVNDFVKLLNAVAHGQSPLGPANAVFDDLPHIAGDVSELGALAAALGIALGRHINLNPLKIVLNILNGAKYLTDLIRSFGAYLFANGNYPTITLRSVAPSAPAPVPSAPTGPGKFVVYPIADGYPGLITAGPDGNLWFAVRSGGSYHIDRITLDGHVTEFPLPAIGFDPQLDESQLSDLTAGPDGALWFTVTPILAQSQPPPGHIGRITTAGKVTLFPLAAAYPPTSLTTGPDGNLWFTQEGAIGRITPEGKITEFPVDLVLSGDITVGADGNIWFAALDNPVGQIGRITRAGKVTLFPLLPGAGGDGCFELCPVTFVSAPDGALWLADVLDGSIVRVTTSGHIATFPVDRSLGAIAVGPDGNIWFSSNDGVARMTLAGSVSHPMPDLQAYGIGTMAAGPDGDLWMAGATTSGKGVIVRAVP